MCPSADRTDGLGIYEVTGSGSLRFNLPHSVCSHHLSFSSNIQLLYHLKMTHCPAETAHTTKLDHIYQMSDMCIVPFISIFF